MNEEGIRNRSPGNKKVSAFDDEEFDEEYDKAKTGVSSGNRHHRGTVAHPDPIAEKMLDVYKSLKLDEYEALRYIILLSPISLIVLFYLFVS